MLNQTKSYNRARVSFAKLVNGKDYRTIPYMDKVEVRGF